jgi:hypothetical protein
MTIPGDRFKRIKLRDRRRGLAADRCVASGGRSEQGVQKTFRRAAMQREESDRQASPFRNCQSQQRHFTTLL